MSCAPEGPVSRYAHVEREVRFRLPRLPDLPGPPAAMRVLRIEDRYVPGTGLRLRRVEEEGRAPLLKLGQKVRLDPASPAAVAHTSMYLTPAEHDTLTCLTARTLRKTRHLVPIEDALQVAVDVFDDALNGLVLAEIDLGGGPANSWHAGAQARRIVTGAIEVTLDERYTGGALAAADGPPPWPAEGGGS